MPATIIKTDNETITLKQNLTCQNYGIDAAECTICNAKYIGQTKTKFSTSVASSQNQLEQRKLKIWQWPKRTFEALFELSFDWLESEWHVFVKL